MLLRVWYACSTTINTLSSMYVSIVLHHDDQSFSISYFFILLFLLFSSSSFCCIIIGRLVVTAKTTRIIHIRHLASGMAFTNERRHPQQLCKKQTRSHSHIKLEISVVQCKLRTRKMRPLSVR